jgi:hypothetical protein
MVNEPVPFDQRSTGFMEYRASRQAGFCPTKLAVQNISGLDKPSFGVPTLRAPKSIGPTKGWQMLHSLYFLAIGVPPAWLGVHYLYELSQ